jgi:type IV pilus assembly protein PilY1
MSIASGDREHPLKNTATGSSYNVIDRFFMIKDAGTAVGTPSTANVKLSNLNASPATPALYDGTGSGFYITLRDRRKGGQRAAGGRWHDLLRDQQADRRSATCAANLGQAKAYAVSPFDGFKVTNVLQAAACRPARWRAW